MTQQLAKLLYLGYVKYEILLRDNSKKKICSLHCFQHICHALEIKDTYLKEISPVTILGRVQDPY